MAKRVELRQVSKDDVGAGRRQLFGAAPTRGHAHGDRAVVVRTLDVVWRVADDDNPAWIETDPILALPTLDGETHQHRPVGPILPVAPDLKVHALREDEGFELVQRN